MLHINTENHKLLTFRIAPNSHKGYESFLRLSSIYIC